MRIPLVACCSLLGLAASAEPPSPAARRPAEVTVYATEAQVVREVVATCQPNLTLEFPAIPPAARRESVRAAAQGGQVESVEVSQRALPDAFDPRAEGADRKVLALQDQLAAANDEVGRAQAARAQAQALAQTTQTQIKRELLEPKPSLLAWRTSLRSELALAQAAGQAETDAKARVRQLSRELAKARVEEARLGAARERREIVARVRLSCSGNDPIRVRLGYRVGNASWRPLYRVQLEEKRIALRVDAQVQQASGESWDQVRLSLSTSASDQDATLPEFAPLWVYAEPRPPPPKVLVARQEERTHARSGAGGAQSESAGMATSDQGLSVLLSPAGRADVPTGSAAVRVEVARFALPAQLRSQAAPRLSEAVVRVVEATNAAPFPLLPGPLEVYGGRGLIAAGLSMPQVARGAPLRLPVGTVDGLRVERHILREVAHETGWTGSGKRFRYGYEFVLHGGATPETVELVDQIPVSELYDVTVALEDGTTPGYRLDKLDGLVRWSVLLAPGETKRVQLGFHIDVPSDYETPGL